MAEIKPLRAWRYHEKLGHKIEDLASPLFDVVSDKYRKVLYENPINSIHLSVPMEGPDGHVLEDRISNWKKKEVITQDKVPSIYVYYQYFKLPGSDKEICRKGFICNIRAYEWEEDIIMRHEDTMPHSVGDRKKVLEHTQFNVSPTHGLYTDSSKTIEKYLDESVKTPVYNYEDYQGVRNVMGVIHDFQIIKKIIKIMVDKKVILADGHHRYEGALAYKREMFTKNPDSDGTEPFNFHLMYLTNTESDDLRIFPTHRLIERIKNFDRNKFLHQLEEYFSVRQIENEEDLSAIISGKKWAFGLFLGDNTYKIRLKEERFFEMDWKLPDELKTLDLTILHYFIIEKVLGIPRNKQSRSNKIKFERNLSRCIKKVFSGKADAAIITQEISIKTVKDVCYSGFTLPQKSTYFYPKVICGLLYGSIKPEENNEPIDLIF